MTILMIWAPPHPCPSFSRLLFRPAPTQQSSKSSHTLSVTQKRTRIVIDCSPPHPHEKGPPLSKKKRTRWVQSTPNFSVAHKSTPEYQIQHDLTTCKDAGAQHTGKKKAILQETLQQRSTRTRRTHYRRKGRPLWLETNAIVDDSSMRWLLVSS